MTQADAELRRERLYGRRVGKPLRAHQQSLIETRLAEFSVPQDGPIDLRAMFPKASAFAFEVGFGGGEHLVAQANLHPEWGFIGCEPFINGAAKLVARIVDEKLPNIRLHLGDAREVMPRLPEQCLNAFYLLFPDPWPKARHHKRRFVTARNLDQAARLLRPGGELRVATDIADYARWTLEHLMPHPAFRWAAEHAADWRNRPADWPATRYEQKALRQGRHSTYLRFIRL
ncbi:MAG: tRNA (guanosine(46)-N7)-methyltransferase TrmB [Alphaproteobacteria bacterium]|nr:tRNA (guanosine(46)-N7)-methyltransferase TrmB [Alphaproteobacteria bacterium]